MMNSWRGTGLVRATFPSAMVVGKACTIKDLKSIPPSWNVEASGCDLRAGHVSPWYFGLRIDDKYVLA
jgi:hypothetical protein